MIKIAHHMRQKSTPFYLLFDLFAAALIFICCAFFTTQLGTVIGSGPAADSPESQTSFLSQTDQPGPGLPTASRAGLVVEVSGR